MDNAKTADEKQAAIAAWEKEANDKAISEARPKVPDVAPEPASSGTVAPAAANAVTGQNLQPPSKLVSQTELEQIGQAQGAEKAKLLATFQKEQQARVGHLLTQSAAHPPAAPAANSPTGTP